MKNPLKSAGEKLRNFAQKLTPPKKSETPKTFIDGLGDSGIIGGLALIGTAAFMTAAPSTMLLAGGAFVIAGAGAKFAAAKMPAPQLDVTAPPKAAIPEQQSSSRWTQKISKAFTNARDNKPKPPKPTAPAPAPKPF